VSTRYLTVPVARDAEGGLVVSDLPSFAPPPRLGRDSAPGLEPLTGAPGGRGRPERFLCGVPGRRFGQLEYLVPAAWGSVGTGPVASWELATARG
jgi:hypothetical protein